MSEVVEEIARALGRLMGWLFFEASSLNRGAAPERAPRFPEDVVDRPFPPSMPLSDCPAGWQAKPIRGTPSKRIILDQPASDSDIVTGVWEVSPGSLFISSSVPTKIELLEGCVTITPSGADAVALKPGGIFAVNSGFEAMWEVEATARHRFWVSLPE